MPEGMSSDWDNLGRKIKLQFMGKTEHFGWIKCKFHKKGSDFNPNLPKGKHALTDNFSKLTKSWLRTVPWGSITLMMCITKHIIFVTDTYSMSSRHWTYIQIEKTNFQPNSFEMHRITIDGGGNYLNGVLHCLDHMVIQYFHVLFGIHLFEIG